MSAEGGIYTQHRAWLMQSSEGSYAGEGVNACRFMKLQHARGIQSLTHLFPVPCERGVLLKSQCQCLAPPTCHTSCIFSHTLAALPQLWYRCNQEKWLLLSGNVCSKILCDFQINQNMSCGQRRTYFLGAWSLETASQEGKSGLQQARRSSSRALAVAASACSLYSSSVRNLTTRGSVANQDLIFLKHMISGCQTPILMAYKNTYLKYQQ